MRKNLDFKNFEMSFIVQEKNEIITRKVLTRILGHYIM